MYFCVFLAILVIFDCVGDDGKPENFMKMKFLVVSLLPIRISLTWKNAEFLTDTTNFDFKKWWYSILFHSKRKKTIEYWSFNISWTSKNEKMKVSKTVETLPTLHPMRWKWATCFWSSKNHFGAWNNNHSE